LITIQTGRKHFQGKAHRIDQGHNRQGWGGRAYAFANVTPIRHRQGKSARSASRFLIDPGRRVYVRGISVVGNTRTRNEVVRREMRPARGQFFRQQKAAALQQRIDKTGFFSEVEVETPAVPRDDHQVDVTVSSEGEAHRRVLLAWAFNIDKFIVQASVQQSQFFRHRQYRGVQVASGSVQQVASLFLYRSLLHDRRVSRGFDLYRRDVNATSLDIGKTTRPARPAERALRSCLSPSTTLVFGFGTEHVKLSLAADSPQRYLDFQNQFGGTYPP